MEMIKIKIIFENGKEIVKEEKQVVTGDVDDLVQWHARAEKLENYIVSINFPEKEEIYYDQTLSEGEVIIYELSSEKVEQTKITYWVDKNKSPFSGQFSVIEYHTLPSGHRFSRRIDLWKHQKEWWIKAECCPDGWAVHGVINRCVLHGSAKISLTKEEFEKLCCLNTQELFKMLSELAQRAGVPLCWNKEK
jgi:hypothetical protein